MSEIPGITENEFNDIELVASKAMREWERGYVCQDINVRHHISWWIAQEAHRRATEAERERCALLIEQNMLCGPDGVEVIRPRDDTGNKVGLAYSEAIRAPSTPNQAEAGKP